MNFPDLGKGNVQMSIFGLVYIKPHFLYHRFVVGDVSLIVDFRLVGKKMEYNSVATQT